jgi:hypothetical protein
MPPKAQASGGNPPRVPLERLLNMSITTYDPQMCYDFLANEVPTLRPFEKEWVQKGCSGSAVVTFGPPQLLSELRTEFPSMSVDLRAKILAVIQKRVLFEHQKGTEFIRVDLGKMWAPAESIAVAPPSELTTAPRSFKFGGSKLAQFVTSPFRSPSYPGTQPPWGVATNPFQPPASAVANPPFPPASAVAGNIQIPPPPVRGSAMAPQSFSNVAEQIAAAASAGRPSSDVAPRPPPPAYLSQPDSAVPAADGSNIEEQMRFASSLLRSQGLVVSVVSQTPWDKVAATVVVAEDERMPMGFDRIDIHEKIQKVIADRTAKGNVGLQVNAKKVTWPVMKHFIPQDFRDTRTLFHECVNSSMHNGIFSTFKDCLSPDARAAACLEFKMNDNQLAALEDSVFMHWCNIFFGPKSVAEAKLLLSGIRIETHRDKNHSQADFVSKFDRVALKFLLAVNDIAICHEFWKMDAESIATGDFGQKELMRYWYDTFPKQGITPISCQIATCRGFFDSNKKMLFRDQARILRQHFSFIDREVLSLTRCYTTMPSEPDKADEDHVSHVGARQSLGRGGGHQSQGRGGGQFNHDRGRGRGRGAHIQDRFQSRDSNRRDGGSGRGAARQGIADGRNPSRFAGGIKKKVVQGSARCPACGSLNNHYGLGASKDTCPLYGTEFAKKAGYRWGNSEEEPTVFVNKDFYDKRLQDNPKILDNWKKAKAQKRSFVSALHVDVDDCSDEENERLAEDIHPVDGDSPMPTDDEVNSDNYFHASGGVDKLMALMDGCDVDVLAETYIASTECNPFHHPLALYGHEKQFFGVSRFASNDLLTAKTLLDPGAEINIIGPIFANRSAVRRASVDVQIFQGKRKQTTVSEAVECTFELQSSDGSWKAHTAWFAVCDLGYSVLLGRKFCKMNGFTSFDEKLATYDSYKAQSIDSENVVVEELQSVQVPCSGDTIKLLFSRELAPQGEARNKRKAKTIVATIHDSDSNVISLNELTATNPLSALQVIDRRSDNGLNFVQLEFMTDKKQISKAVDWFQISASVDSGIVVCKDFVSRHKLENNLLARNQVAVVSALIGAASPNGFSPREPCLTDGITNRFVAEHGLRIAKREPSPNSQRFKANKARSFQSDVAFLATQSLDTNDHVKDARLKKHQRTVTAVHDAGPFVSYHPLHPSHPGYILKRSAEPPLSPHWKKDHRNLEINRDYKAERAAVIAAYELASDMNMCIRQERKLNRMLSKVKVAALSSLPADVNTPLMHHSLEYHLDVMEFDKMCAQAAVSQCATLSVTTSDDASFASTFKPGQYVKIAGAVKSTELNGQRCRLHSKTDVAGRWVVRILGKNSGLWFCKESFFKLLPPIQQQLSVPSSADAGFDDVGIDSTGLPDAELKCLAHRQFGKEYSAALTKRIEELKSRYPTVFTEDVSEPCLFEPMKIKLIPNAVLPSKARFYRNTPKMRDEIRRQIQEQLAWGVVRKCVTPHVSDVLLVKRPHMPGKFRFVVSYIKLNDATVKEQLIMPDPKSQHERLAGNRIFGALDFSSYYRQIRLHEDSQLLTGFASDEGTYCYTRVPMGITGACQYAQKVLQDKLAADPVLGPLGIKNYFDDLPFGAQTEDDFIAILKALLDFCVTWKLKVNPSKSVLGVTSITHVGFVVSEQGVAIDPERTRDILELAEPKSIKKVQSVLGIFNYVRNFIPGFSEKAKFLTDKLAAVPVVKAVKESSAKSVLAALSAVKTKSEGRVKLVPKFTWSPDDKIKFEQLKQCVLDAPLLAQLDYSKPIFIRCDASKFGCGAVLFQYDERGFENVVCYASRKFLPSERNWSTFSQEASTVVWALERFAEYTQGYHTIVECDHRNISFVKRSAMPQLARWRLRLLDMDFSIRFLAGSQNATADGLSRQHVDDVEVELQDVIPECALVDAREDVQASFAEIAAVEFVFIAPTSTRAGSKRQAENEVVAEAADQSIEPLNVDLSDNSDESDSVCSDNDGPFEFGENGEILQDGAVVATDETQPEHLLLPAIDAETEIRNVHNDLVGHAGVFVTLQRALRNSRSWDSRAKMLQDIDNFIKGCPCCQKLKKRSSRSLDVRHTISGSPFSEVSIDLLKLPKPDAYGMQYVVVVVDSFSHWTSCVAVRNKSAFEAARALMHVIGSFGAPLRIRSDGGAEFVNGVIAGLTKMMGITQHVVVPYTPTANGIVERANRSILERLREMIFCQRLKFHSEHVWSDLLPLAQRAINASVHSATGVSPARILFGDNLDLDRCLLTAMPSSKSYDVSTYIGALTHNQRTILEVADLYQSRVCERVIAKATKKQQRFTKRHGLQAPAVKSIAVGDWVLCKPAEQYPLHKLAPRWLGPWQVRNCSDTSEVVIVYDANSRKRRKCLRRNLELFDVSQLVNEEGLTRVAEKDRFEFPVEAIIGHALVNEGGIGADAVQLEGDFRRGSRGKNCFQFLVRWAGYIEPTWINYRVASKLIQFPGYVAMFPGLRMD